MASTRKIDPAVETILKECGLNAKEVLWDCHGTWCMYHRAVEGVAAKLGFFFDPPQVLEANGAGKSVALCVTGYTKDGRSEWSIGEASPANCKNAYPYAMAEKRAKDRVVLKLIGLHGLVYSEEEMEEKGGAGKQAPPDEPDVLQGLLEEIAGLGSEVALQRWWTTRKVAGTFEQLDKTEYEKLVAACAERKAAVALPITAAG